MNCLLHIDLHYTLYNHLLLLVFIPSVLSRNHSIHHRQSEGNDPTVKYPGKEFDSKPRRTGDVENTTLSANLTDLVTLSTDFFTSLRREKLLSPYASRTS